MQINIKRLTALLLALVIVLSTVVPSFAAGQPSSYSTKRNSGERHVVCTTLDGTSADDYYTGSYTYDSLSTLSSTSLLNSLRTLMKTTHKKQTSYDDCKNYADETDCENGGSSIITIYTSYASSQSEYSGGSGWNREHVWPKSLGGFNTSGAGADLHHIRPSENKTNSDRGNLKYGNVNGGTASKGNLSGIIGGYKGSYYEPLDNVKGDVARICLYVYVRYGGELSKCSSITNVFQSIDVLLEWCELDPVDTWEMGRNEVVYAIQGNRNVFIDYPEYAWLVFGREVPSDMTTPSGEAKGGSGGSSGTTCRHTNTVTKDAVSATCSTAGYTGDKYCSSCGEKVSTGTTISPNGNHTLGTAVVVTPPTETSAGLQKQTCTVCGYEKTTTIPKLDSDPCVHANTQILNAISPTCQTNGYTGDTYCMDCGIKISGGSTILANGEHQWSEREIVKHPTATEEGLSREICEICGEELLTPMNKLEENKPVGQKNYCAEKIIIAISLGIFEGLIIETIS